jgi:hypothetical protein
MSPEGTGLSVMGSELWAMSNGLWAMGKGHHSKPITDSPIYRFTGEAL